MDQRTAPAHGRQPSRLAALVPDIWDVLVLAGLIVFLVGVRKIYEPAAWVVGGLVLAGFGYYGAARWES